MKQAVNTITLLILISSCVASCGAVAQESKSTSPSAKESHKTLDLRPPDITKMSKSKQMSDYLASFDSIEVVGAPELLPQTDTEAPQPWGGVAAPIWALLHPTAAWRIFAPISDETRSMSHAPDTVVYGPILAGIR